MIILFHVVCALSSILYTALAYFTPSLTKLRVSYLLVAATLGSGIYLVVITHSRLIESCLAGLFYLSIVAFEIFSVQRKLIRESNE